jgi:hypothetical protein
VSYIENRLLGFPCSFVIDFRAFGSVSPSSFASTLAYIAYLEQEIRKSFDYQEQTK